MVFAPGSRLEKIGRGGFCDSGIKRIVIPKSVEIIQDSTFYKCKNLKEVAFEEGSKLKIIQAGTFYGCANLTNINLPEGLARIIRCAFCYCKSLKEIRLPNQLEEIGSRCF